MKRLMRLFLSRESSRRLYLADKWIDRMSELEDEVTPSQGKPVITSIAYLQKYIGLFAGITNIYTAVQS